MANTALERAREITRKAREDYDSQLNAEQDGAPVDGGEQESQESAQALDPNAAQAESSQTEDHSQQDEGEQDKPEAAPDATRELLAKVEELQKNYDNLRSWADRVSGENSTLRGDNEKLTSQVSVLLADRQRGSQAPAPQPSAQPREGQSAEQVPTQRADETDQDYLGRLVGRYQDLQDADADYGHIIRPLIKVIHDLEKRVEASEQNVRSQLDPVMQSMQTEIKQSAEERQRTATQRYFAEIADKQPNYHQKLTSEEFANFIHSNPMGQTYQQLLWPEEFQGARRGTAQEVIGILSVFDDWYASQGASDAARQQEQREQQEARQQARQQAAEEAVEPSIRPTAPAQQADGEAIKRSDIVKWAKDPGMWKEKRHQVQQALSEGRVIEGA